MRIALLAHGGPLAAMGGVGLYVEALSAALVAAGQTVVVISPLPAAPSPGVEAWSPPPVQTPGLPGTWACASRRAAFRAFFRRWRPDVVHVHHIDGLGFDGPRAARELGIPVVLTLHDYAIPCARGQRLDLRGEPCAGPSPIACAACLGPRLRRPGWLQAVGRRLPPWPTLRARLSRPPNEEPTAAEIALLGRRQAAAQALLEAADLLLSPSADLADQFAAMGLPRPALTPLPLLGPVRPRPVPRAPGPPRLLFVGALHPSKGVDLLVAAFAALPPGQATLAIIGPDVAVEGRPDWAGDLRRRHATTPGLHFCGPLPAAAVRGRYADHDALLLPSRWRENSPLVVREATAAGLHTLLSVDGGGLALDPAATIVRNGDPADLQRGLRQIIESATEPRPLRAWEDPAAHAARLVSAVYRPLRDGAGGSLALHTSTFSIEGPT